MTEQRYELGRRYKTLGGDYVLLEGHGGDNRSQDMRGTEYETMYSIDHTGKRVHRYTYSLRSDVGRVTARPADHPDNLVWPPEPVDMDGSYCATEGGEVCRRPKRTETGINMGFIVCRVEGIGKAEVAEEVAEALNLHRMRYPGEHD